MRRFLSNYFDLLLNMQREHFVPIVQSLYVVNGSAGFAELSKNMVLLLDILEGLSVVNVSGIFLSRLSLCNLLYIFLFVLFSLSVALYSVNLRLI